jgi:hypothetical protein
LEEVRNEYRILIGVVKPEERENLGDIGVDRKKIL